MNTTSHYATSSPSQAMRFAARRIAAALLALAASIAPAMALADGNTAKGNLVATMKRAGAALPNLDAAGTIVVPAPVKGLYGIYSADRRLITLTNEAGTITGIGTDLSTVGIEPGKPRRMTPAQVTALRAEVMANIEYDKLIKVTYGNGGGRRILMLSALDCPGCTMLEKELHKAAPVMNTTFYITAGSLSRSTDGGLPFLEKVARIRCDNNPGQAWQTYWAKRSVPPVRACAITAHSAEYDTELLIRILMAAKSVKPLFPTLLAEDGKSIPLFADMTPAKAAAAFGPERKRQAIQPTTQWLAAATVAAHPAKAR